MEKRPKINIELTQWDKIIEIISWLILIALWTLVLFNYPELPPTIPIHFNASGQADSYGSKSTIFLLPVIGTVISIGMSILGKFPHVFNYPLTITSENAIKQYTGAVRLLRFLRLAIGLVFFAIVLSIYLTSTGKASGLGKWFLPLTLALFFIPIIYYFIRSFNDR